MKGNKVYKYYDKKWFDNILYLVEQRRYSEAMESCRDYVERYPYDLGAVTSYASFLINLGYLDEAEEVLKNVSCTKYAYGKDMTQAKYMNIRLLGCKNQFDECYKMLKDNVDEMIKFRYDYNFMMVFLNKKLGLPIEVDIPDHSYNMRQVLEYDENLAIEYIEKHFFSHKKIQSIFDDSFSIHYYYQLFRQMIPLINSRRMFTGLFKNIYMFKYDHGGIYSNKLSNYIKVVALQDSNEILAMYPTDNIEGYPYVSITPRVEEIETGSKLIKRKSQIEKFNQRYLKN